MCTQSRSIVRLTRRLSDKVGPKMPWVRTELRQGPSVARRVLAPLHPQLPCHHPWRNGRHRRHTVNSLPEKVRVRLEYVSASQGFNALKFELFNPGSCTTPSVVITKLWLTRFKLACALLKPPARATKHFFVYDLVRYQRPIRTAYRLN